jgi:hypothetical protein
LVPKVPSTLPLPALVPVPVVGEVPELLVVLERGRDRFSGLFGLLGFLGSLRLFGPGLGVVIPAPVPAMRGWADAGAWTWVRFDRLG